jgi:large subunit ribosomal protein L10
MSQVVAEKQQVVDETVKLLGEYSIIGAADLTKVGSGMLQDMRRQLRDHVLIKGIKNTLMEKAMEKAGLEGLDEFKNKIKGQNVYLFSNGNPFRLAMTLHNNKVSVFAKEGDIALNDITISAGNTGLAPGPLISKFGSLSIRTRIESGNIWVTQDTQVVKVGDEINADLADLLVRLGIRAAEMGLEIKAVYENGEVIPGKDLILDMDEYLGRLTQAYGNAFQVAMHSAYATKETTAALIMLAFQNVKKVAVEAQWITPETAAEIIQRANAQAISLAKAVGKAQAQG